MSSSKDSASKQDEQLKRPLTPAADSTNKSRTELAKTQLKNSKPGMVSQSVNKTALHPGGVQ